MIAGVGVKDRLQQAKQQSGLRHWTFLLTGSILLPVVSFHVFMRTLWAPQATSKPPSLSVVQQGDVCTGRALVLRIHNDTGGWIDIPETMRSAKLMVDGVIHEVHVLAWIGMPYLYPGQNYKWAIDPKGHFGLAFTKGSHVVSIEFGKRWSPKIIVKCG